MNIHTVARDHSIYYRFSINLNHSHFHTNIRIHRNIFINNSHSTIPIHHFSVWRYYPACIISRRFEFFVGSVWHSHERFHVSCIKSLLSYFCVRVCVSMNETQRTEGCRSMNHEWITSAFTSKDFSFSSLILVRSFKR